MGDEHALPDRLRDEVAVVTGAGRGIGRAVARRLAAEGARVVVDDIAADGAEETVALIEQDGGSAVPFAGDASDPEAVGELFETASRAFAPVSILVNNAGLIGQVRHFLEVDLEWWNRLIKNNLQSTFLCSNAAAQIMARRRHGVILSSSSGGATRAHRGEAPYDATKGAIEALTRALALELAPYGIRVNAVAPGSINVAPPGTVSDDVLRSRGETIPLGRVGTPEDLAPVYAFLASDDARYITGVVVAVDGGMVAQQRSPQVDLFGLDKFPKVEPDEAATHVGV
jgi:NAD(P)-dependent dehydrogenase (short-subunit alcohol dehydrogenase family)